MQYIPTQSWLEAKSLEVIRRMMYIFNCLTAQCMSKSDSHWINIYISYTYRNLRNHGTLTLLISWCICTVYPKKYAHGFVVLCFVVVMQSFIMDSHEVFIHMYNHNKAQQSKNRVHISWDILYVIFQWRNPMETSFDVSSVQKLIHLFYGIFTL